MVASDLALPPVTTLPFDYEEIYKQWALNRNRGRGRGRGTAAGNASEGQQQSDRSRSNGKWEEGGGKWDGKSSKKEGEEDQAQGEGDSTWQRGLKISGSKRDDIWDDVGDLGGDSNEMVSNIPLLLLLGKLRKRTC